MEIAIALLQHYSFDLGGYSIQDLTHAWRIFKPEWVRQAVIESLFQGRYKAISVNQILQLWQRKGEPHCRYNHEFERLVCGDVAVIYEDRIYYTPPRTSVQDAAITEIAPFRPVSEAISPIPFPKRAMLGNLGKQTTNSHSPFKYPRHTMPSGTTTSIIAPRSTSTSEYSLVYESAYANMTLLAETSMFVDKLRSMCGEPASLYKEERDIEATNNNVMVER
ncbi:hypothetical protein [Pseudanabaena mucicola]|uniref:Uncharacterized protein n=1 Tax=Pseudanabaena mucicola FACHB-723 TaxID=2692860 RepID=A0ABR7ZU82_9CYAN|nr:hypothetical protein [Pseudanabaena mucicola]MBD2187040.1 hypothetical protein [Pseudanabaena mucicola FACHB-723]